MDQKIKDLLELALANKASDVHLSVNISPKFRIDGELVSVGNFSMSENLEMATMILSVLSKDQKTKFDEEKDMDFSVTLGDSRFRGNVYLDKGNPAMVLRVIPFEIPSMVSLNLCAYILACFV